MQAWCAGSGTLRRGVRTPCTHPTQLKLPPLALVELTTVTTGSPVVVPQEETLTEPDRLPGRRYTLTPRAATLRNWQLATAVGAAEVG